MSIKPKITSISIPLNVTTALRSLIFVPETYENGVETMDFSPLVYSCGTKSFSVTPSITANYYLNPSTVTEKQIKKDELVFAYNNPKTRSSKIDAKANFISIKKGVLSVSVKVNRDFIEKAGSGKIDMIALQVPISDVALAGDPTAEAIITSGWSKVSSNDISPLRIVKKNPKEKLVNLHTYPKTLLDARNLSKTAPSVISLPYDGSVDLLKEVESVVSQSAQEFLLDIEKYGLEYHFDLNDEKGKKIVYNEGTNSTDQQQFISLEGTVIKSRVFTIDGPNPASVDRTPIVHVTLKDPSNKECGKVLEAFIKINIIKKKVTVEPIDAINFVQEDFIAVCEDYAATIGTEDMNVKLYAAAKLSKDEFHKKYTSFSQTTAATNVGTIQQRVDPNITESYNIVWNVAADDIWNNIGKKIEINAVYKGVGLPDINIKLSVNVKKPAMLDLSKIIIKNYWNDEKTEVKHNVAVPGVGSTDNNLCTYANNINAAFLTNSDKSLQVKGYGYEYIFDKEQPIKSVKKEDGSEIKITVSPNGKQLLGNSDVIAEITDFVSGKGDILDYKDNATATYLLNKDNEFMSAKIKVLAHLCGNKNRKVDVELGNTIGDVFNVKFIRPIKATKTGNKSFKDAVDVGTNLSFIDVLDIVEISDWRNLKFKDNVNYYDYYRVTKIEVDKDKIRTDMTPDNSLPSTIKVNQTAPDANHKYGTFTYQNNGSLLQKTAKLYLPITVTYKWGKIINTVIEVNVDPVNK